jgi:hypothetical protein
MKNTRYSIMAVKNYGSSITGREILIFVAWFNLHVDVDCG